MPARENNRRPARNDHHASDNYIENPCRLGRRKLFADYPTKSGIDRQSIKFQNGQGGNHDEELWRN